MTGGVKLDPSKFMKRRSEDRKIKCTICTKVYRIKCRERSERRKDEIYKLNIKLMFSFHIATPSTQCDIQRHKRYLRNYELVTWQSSTSAAAPPPGASVQSPHLWCWSLTGTFSVRTEVLCFKMCLIQIHWSQVKPEWHHVSVLLAW